MTEVTSINQAAKREKQRTIFKNCRFKPSELSLIEEAAERSAVSVSHLLRHAAILVAQEIIQRDLPHADQ
jgi:uncharacterized protein (DUF1778 family)